MRTLALGLALLAGACAEGAKAPVFELRSVVEPAQARYADLAVPEAAPEADADTRERFEAVVGPLRGGNADLHALVIEDARGLSPAGIELLARALLDPTEPEVGRIGLAEVLGALAKPRALDALCTGLESAAEPAVRLQCAYRLGQAGDDRVVPRLLLRLKYEKDFETVYWIADALARMGHLQGIEALFVLWSGAASSGAPSSGAASEELRGNAGARLAELATAHGQTDAVALRKAWSEGALPPERAPSRALELEAWRWIARLGEWNWRTVDDARFVLEGLEGWVVPMLSEALHEEEVYVRLHATQCLERRARRGAGAARELEAALIEPRIAPTAASALAAIGASEAVPALERAASASADLELSTAAARALGVLGLARSLPVLEALYASAGAIDLRQAAAQALLAIEPAHAALSFVRECLQDERADGGAAENALGAWLAKRAAADPALGDVLARWESLAGAQEHIPTEAEVRERRGARAEIMQALVR